MRGQVAELAGDRKAADRWFAEAIRQAPRLPQAYAERATARLARGDIPGAIADAQQANRVGPHFADALKLWGDALGRQGDWRGARAKYDAAFEYAPAWPQLRQARAAAASGR
jgi:tetratricopeptide (TPR) repeat protein